MTEHRYQARAEIVAGACELGVDGSLIQLVTLTLTDEAPITRPDASDDERPDVSCALRTSEARSLAGRLLELADHADRTEAPTR
jgi:hypothetical protein